MKKRILFIFNALLLFALASSPVFAQTNLFANINPGFDESGGAYTSEYERIYGPNGVDAGQYAIDNTTANHGGGIGWPQPENSTGRFMIVNGFGGSVNPTKIVWTPQQPVTVTPNTDYVFSCRVVNLNRAVNGQIYPAILQLKINGVAVGSENQLPSNNYWQTWMVSWNSQNATQALVAIYDMYTGNSGLGDDYALDDMYFAESEGYSITAHDDADVAVCQNEAVDIDVLANDIILPDANNVTVEVVTPPLHGTAEVQDDHTIRYTFTGGNYTSDQIQYRVTTHGTSAEAWVYVTTKQLPVIGTLQTPPAVCMGNDLDVSVPSFDGDGMGAWEICQTQDGIYQPFDIQNVSDEFDQWYLRYRVSNDCGDTVSNAEQIHVNKAPEIANIAAPEAICAGGSFSLTEPAIQDNGSAIIHQGWQIAATASGTYMDFDNNDVPYANNGYWIRYFAENECGEVYGDAVQIIVFPTEPIFDTISACDTYTWNNLTCDQSDDYETIVQSIDGCDITAHLHFELSDAYSETQPVVACDSYTWAKNGHTYTVSGTDEYTVESGNPLVCDSIFTLNLTINHAPEIMEDIVAPAAICVGDALLLTEPQFVINHVDGGEHHWEYATSANGPFSVFDPASNQLGYGDYYVRFVVINDCDVTSSNVVPFRVNAAPEMDLHLSDMQACENQPLDLPEVSVTWLDNTPQDRVAEWQMSLSPNGNYAAFNPATPMQMGYDGCWLRFEARNACGHAVVGPVRVTVIAETEEWLETITECDSYTLESGTVITQDYTVDYEVYDPCLRIVHQPIVINHSDSVVVMATSCRDVYEWHGQVFERSDEMQYGWVTLTNASNCDSVVELHLDFGPYNIYTEAQTACGSYEWSMNPGHVYYESQRDSVFVAAVGEEDCDSWYYLDLTIGHDALYDGGTMTECSGFEWHGIPYYEDAIVYDSLLTSVTHCDSIVSYALTIVSPVETETEMTSCQPTWWQGHYFEMDGDVYQHVFVSHHGCDSIVTMHFSLAEEMTMEVDTTACEPFEWYGNVCNSDGMVCQHVFHTSQGCDSTVFMHVRLVEEVSNVQHLTACDRFEYGGVVYDEPGTIVITTDTVFSQSGCDSIVNQLQVEIRAFENAGQIVGDTVVYVASNLVSGVYTYEVDVEEISGNVFWELSNPEWRIIATDNDFCRIFVASPGAGSLTARFHVEACGDIQRTIAIRAGYYGVGEEVEKEVQVYPNPSQGTVHIEAEGIKWVRVVDMMGQVVGNLKVGGQDHVTMDLSGLAQSMYMLEVETAQGAVRKRVALYR